MALLDISLRDYFASNAPEIPSWFEFKPASLVLEEVPTDRKNPDIKAIQERNQARSEAYQKSLDIKKLTAWRYYYADAMISEGVKPK